MSEARRFGDWKMWQGGWNETERSLFAGSVASAFIIVVEILTINGPGREKTCRQGFRQREI